MANVEKLKRNSFYGKLLTVSYALMWAFLLIGLAALLASLPWMLCIFLTFSAATYGISRLCSAYILHNYDYAHSVEDWPKSPHTTPAGLVLRIFINLMDVVVVMGCFTNIGLMILEYSAYFASLSPGFIPMSLLPPTLLYCLGPLAISSLLECMRIFLPVTEKDRQEGNIISKSSKIIALTQAILWAGLFTMGMLINYFFSTFVAPPFFTSPLAMGLGIASISAIAGLLILQCWREYERWNTFKELEAKKMVNQKNNDYVQESSSSSLSACSTAQDCLTLSPVDTQRTNVSTDAPEGSVTPSSDFNITQKA